MKAVVSNRTQTESLNDAIVHDELLNSARNFLAAKSNRWTLLLNRRAI